MDTFSMVLIYCVVTVLSLIVLYWIIKSAVKNGILEANKELTDPEQKVQYPIKIDENNPDMPFHKDE